jgi:hypothetical protein
MENDVSSLCITGYEKTVSAAVKIEKKRILVFEVKTRVSIRKLNKI